MAQAEVADASEPHGQDVLEQQRQAVGAMQALDSGPPAQSGD